MIRVAIQGVIGSYSEQAALEILGPRISLVESEDFEGAFSAVLGGHADHAVIPVENKIVGEIHATRKLLAEGPFQVLDELAIKVRHVLAGTRDADLARLSLVLSHPAALMQCSNFLSSNSHLRPIQAADTASSVRKIVCAGDSANAAIGSRRAAEIYGAKVLCKNIANDVDNWTIFYLIGKKAIC